MTTRNAIYPNRNTFNTPYDRSAGSVINPLGDDFAIDMISPMITAKYNRIANDMICFFLIP